MSVFTAISDNYFLPELKGVQVDRERGLIATDTLMINSLGIMEHWRLVFKCREGIEMTAHLMRSPKMDLVGLSKDELERKIKGMADDPVQRFRLHQFFVNEYYPAIIHTGDQMVLLMKTVESVIARGVLLIPADAVIEGERGRFVLRVEGERVRRTEVEIGANNYVRAQVLSGLSAGDEVVVDGKDAVSDGDRVRIEILDALTDLAAL